MKYLKYALLLVSVNSYALSPEIRSHGTGYKIISSEYHENVPMPEFLKHQKGSLTMTNGVTAIAYGGTGSSSGFLAYGYLGGDFTNSTDKVQYYVTKNYVCAQIDKEYCNFYETTYGLTPGGHTVHDIKLPLEIKAASGKYLQTAYITVTNAEELSANSTAYVYIS